MILTEELIPLIQNIVPAPHYSQSRAPLEVECVQRIRKKFKEFYRSSQEKVSCWFLHKNELSEGLEIILKKKQINSHVVPVIGIHGGDEVQQMIKYFDEVKIVYHTESYGVTRTLFYLNVNDFTDYFI